MENIHFNRLNQLVQTLRGEPGCPWDKEQTPQTMSKYMQEEVMELVEAIQSDNPNHICEELGDVLFHILFISRMFEEQGHFNIEEVMLRIHEKMIRRHPHVFGNATAANADEVRDQWQKIKEKEKRHKRQ